MITTAVCLSLFGLLTQVAAQNLCNRMDLVFLVDSSSSLHNTNFQLVKTQLSSVLDYFYISSEETRIGIVTYGTGVFEVVPFSSSVANVREAINRLNYQNGGTDTNQGLDRAVQMFQQANRQNAAKVVVLVTDGMSTNPSLTLASASYAKSQDVRIYVIGVGDDVNSNELNSVATSANYVFMASSFSSLATQLVEFASRVCRIETTTTSTTMTTTPYLICDKQLDVIFVLDGSSSVKNVNFQSAVSSLINTVQFFMPSASRTRMGAITYATGIFQSLPLTDNRNVITDGLKALTYPNGGTDTDQAIRAATAELVSKKQSGVPQIMVVITDGLSTNPPATLQAAAEAKQAGISIFALGIGLNDNTELQAISSDQNQMYHVETFQNLTTALASSVVDVCRAVSAPTSPIATTPLPIPTFTPSPVSGVCSKAVDIMVLLDASSAVGTDNFQFMKLYLLTFLRLFAISPSQARFGGLCYGSSLSGNFGPSTTESEVVNAILRLPYLGDSVRYTDTAIAYGNDLLYTNRRSGARSALIVLTTGASANPSNTVSRLQDALTAGINVYVIGIASNQGLSELTRVLPSSRLRFASSWASLPSTLRDVASDICS